MYKTEEKNGRRIKDIDRSRLRAASQTPVINCATKQPRSHQVFVDDLEAKRELFAGELRVRLCHLMSIGGRNGRKGKGKTHRDGGGGGGGKREQGWRQRRKSVVDLAVALGNNTMRIERVSSQRPRPSGTSPRFDIDGCAGNVVFD